MDGFRILLESVDSWKEAKLPITPLHVFAVLWIFFRYPHRVDPTALILSTSLVDLESLAGIIFETGHGVWHSYVGAALIAVPLARLTFLGENKYSGFLARVYQALHLPYPRENYSFKVVLITFLFGSLSHVLLDSFTHRSFPNILFPFQVSRNPFWLGFSAAYVVIAVVIILAICSILLWIDMVWNGRVRQ